jgi:hypothetical protein
VIGELFKGHKPILPTEPDSRIDGRVIAAANQPLVMASECMSEEVTLSVIQAVAVGIAQGQIRQFSIRDSLHSQPGLQVTFAHLDIASSAPIPGASLLATFRHRLNVKVGSQSTPAADPDSLDHDVRVHEDDLSGLHAGAPVS